MARLEDYRVSVRVCREYTVNVKAEKACDLLLFFENKHLLPPESRQTIENLLEHTNFVEEENVQECCCFLEIKKVELAHPTPYLKSKKKSKNS